MSPKEPPAVHLSRAEVPHSGARRIPEAEAIVSLKLMPSGEECSAPERQLLQCRGMTEHSDSAADPSALSPDSPHAALLCSALSSLEPTISGCK